MSAGNDQAAVLHGFEQDTESDKAQPEVLGRQATLVADGASGDEGPDRFSFGDGVSSSSESKGV